MVTSYLSPGFDEVERRLEGVRLRIGRARVEAEKFENNAGTFYRHDRYRLERELDDEGRQHVYRIFGLPAPPPTWAIEVGFILYLLRSSLDHTVNALGLYEGIATGNAWDDSRAEFPVCQVRKDYRTSGRKKVQGLPAAAVDAIYDAQPFNDTRRYALDLHPLWLVHDLNRVDKHRYVHVVTEAAIGGMHFLPEGVDPPEPVLSHEPIEDGSEIVRYSFTDPHPEIDLRPLVFLVPALELPIIGRGNLNELLERLTREISDVIAKVVRADPRFGAWPGLT